MKNIPFRVLAFAVFCLVMAGSAWWFANWLESFPGKVWQQGQLAMKEEAMHVRDQFLALANFQPQIRINNTVVFEKKSPITELAVLSRPVEVSREWEHTWAGSTKRLNLHGRFLVKSGFVLDDRLEVEVNRTGTHVFLPPARILNVELLSVDFQTENGWWNEVNDQERKEAVMALQAQARLQSADLNREAAEAFRKQLLALLGSKTVISIGHSILSDNIPSFDPLESR